MFLAPDYLEYRNNQSNQVLKKYWDLTSAVGRSGLDMISSTAHQ